MQNELNCCETVPYIDLYNAHNRCVCLPPYVTKVEEYHDILAGVAVAVA